MAASAPIWSAGLEIRREGGRPVMVGSFRYASEAKIGGYRERVLPGAFEPSDRGVMLLRSHDPDQPLARNVAIDQDESEMRFRAELPAESDQPGYVIDTVKMVRAGLADGLSPGFFVKSESHRQGVRIIRSATLVELSVVASPAYRDASVAVRGRANLIHDSRRTRNLPFPPRSAADVYAWP